MQDHIAYITRDRQGYRVRTDIAIKQPHLKMSVITDKSGSFWLPHFHPMPKEWTNVTFLPVSFVGFINHGLNKRELVFFKETDYVADSDFYISLLFHHLKESLLTLDPGKRPRTLYLQVDNSAAEGKNQYLLQFAAALVHHNWFDEIFIHYLQPGHTHEDIDRLFQLFHTYFRWKVIETMDQAVEFARAIYPKDILIRELQWPVYSWKKWFLGFSQSISGHKDKYAFWIKPGLDNTPSLLYKKQSLDNEWTEVKDELFSAAPSGQPSVIQPTCPSADLIQTIVSKAQKFLSKQVSFQVWNRFLRLV